MAVQTTQEKSSGTADKMNAAGQSTTTVEKKPSTDAKSAARQPAFATAMNAAVPSTLAGTASQSARPAAPAHEPSADHATDAASEAPAETSTLALASAAPIASTAPAASGTAAPSAKPQVRTPATDPRFQKVMHRLDQSATKTKKHPPIKKKAAEAHAAAEPPKNEKLATAKGQQVETMQQAQAKPPDQDSFLTLLTKTIDKNIPENVGETKNFLNDESKQKLKGSMTGTVNKEKAEATGDLKTTTEQKPDTNGIEEKPATPLADEKSPTPSAAGAEEAVPTPKDDSEVSLQPSKQEANDKLKEAQVTPEQLKEANDPRFSAVLTAKAAVDKQADTAPQKYRTDEQKLLTQETANAVADEKQGLAGFQSTHDKSGAAVKLSQLSAKAQDEAHRQEVTHTIETIYDETKQAVEKKLDSLEGDVTKEFDKGVDEALASMRTFIQQRLDERYGGISGFFTHFADVLAPLTQELKTLYNDGRENFKNNLHATVVRVATIVDTRLKEAKDIIAQGQQRIHEYVQKLPKNLQTVGQAAETAIAGRFDELRQGIDEKKHDLAQKLAQRYKEACDKSEEEIKKIKEENKGFLEQLADKIGEITKILSEFRDRITNMLKAGRDTILLIVAHPIDFLKNLINAIKQGVNQFVDNIWTHLKAGFMAWLFGTLEGAGIQIPKDFSLGSILKLVLQILGLTYDRIRAKAVKLIGERNVEIIEKVGKFLYTLITSGPEALWEQIKEFLGNLKEMVLDAIQNWIVTTVIKAAVIKLLSLFNPAGAIIQAIQLIYNTVMFFIERIDQILSFVESIINSVHKIAVGDIGDAANWIEKALARTIPIIIGFLARLLGLGNISEEIQKIIHKIQDFIDKALDKLIDKVVKGIGKLFGKGKGKEEEKPGNVREKAQKELAQRLKSEHTEEEAKGIIKEVFTELQPEGLKRLELGSATTDGEYSIMVEASPYEEMAKLAPKPRIGKKIVMLTKLTLDKASAFSDTSKIPGTEDPGRSLLGGESPKRIPLSPVEGAVKSGGFILNSKLDTEVIYMTTYSTGEPTGPASVGEQPLTGSNRSHAEHQFTEWFDGMGAAWQKRVQSIDIKISESPEILCVDDLCLLRRKLREGANASLTYALPFEGSKYSNPTKSADIEKLRKYGWVVNGPEPQPGKNQNNQQALTIKWKEMIST